MTTPDGPVRRVLVADDDDDIREALRMMLEDEGFEVVEAKDGQLALDILLREDFYAVILDNRMPKLTGREVYERLVAHGRRVPVILVTAMDGIHALASELGIRAFLAKPFALDDLLKALRDAPRLTA